MIGRRHRPPPDARKQILQLAEILLKLERINRKERSIVTELENLQDAVAKLEADAVNIKENVDATRVETAALKQQVVDLLAQIAVGTPVTVAQIQELADRCNAVDAALDAVIPDAAPPA